MSKAEVNRLCYEVIKSYKKGTSEIEYNAKLKKLLMIINSGFIKSLNGDYISYYFIYLFCIMFKEELITKDDIANIVTLSSVDYYSILSMNMALDDNIVLLMLDTIENKKANLYLGKFPYDYRYHIIRRKEISYPVKKRVLNKYSNEELAELSNEIENDIKRIEYFSKVECDSSILKSEEVKDKSRVQDCISLQLRRKK